MHKEVKELREAHESWESFEGALLEAYGYTKPEWVCRQLKEKRSATTRPASGGEERVASGYALPPEESVTGLGNMVPDREQRLGRGVK